LLENISLRVAAEAAAAAAAAAWRGERGEGDSSSDCCRQINRRRNDSTVYSAGFIFVAKMLELRAAYERRPMQMYANYIIFRVRYATSLAANQSYDVVASVEATDCPAGESHFDLSSSRCLSCSAIFTRCSCCRTTVRARARARARERGGRGEEEEEEGTIWDD